MAIRGDIRYAIRVLLKARSFTLGVVRVLALGIGANAAVFSALDQTVIRPLPYGARDAEIEVGLVKMSSRGVLCNFPPDRLRG